MAGLAGVFNPELPEQQILAFYTTAAGHLGFEPVEASSEDDVTANAADGTSTMGVIRVPSQLAVVYFKKLIRVYAILKDKSMICTLSPGYKWLEVATDAQYSSLAACGDGDSQAWLYYLLGSSDEYRIMEYDLRRERNTDIKISGLVKNAGSYLAACWDSTAKKRYLFGQKDDRTLFRYTDGSVDTVKGSNVAVLNAPIAVVANGSKSQVHIYFFVGSDKKVHRISWTPSGGYGDARSVEGPDYQNFTTIAAVPDKDCVHVFYLYQKSIVKQAMCHSKDNWA